VFTGIVEERGRVILRGEGSGGTRIAVLAPAVAGGARPGDSISVNGVCLTVVESNGGAMSFDLAPETLARTTLGDVHPGDHVNLERPVTLATRLGGHLVQGHVDGVGTVERVERNGGGTEMTLSVPEELSRYVVEKGSVAVDGVSLTVAGADDRGFRVALVPHTLQVTTLGERAEGDAVNLEMDVVAKYLERLVRRQG
jgi:riboflavin synthase